MPADPKTAQGFINYIFALMSVTLCSPSHTSFIKRAKSINVSFKTPTLGEIAYQVIDSTELKVFGEAE